MESAVQSERSPPEAFAEVASEHGLQQTDGKDRTRGVCNSEKRAVGIPSPRL